MILLETRKAQSDNRGRGDEEEGAEGAHSQFSGERTSWDKMDGTVPRKEEESVTCLKL